MSGPSNKRVANADRTPSRSAAPPEAAGSVNPRSSRSAACSSADSATTGACSVASRLADLATCAAISAARSGTRTVGSARSTSSLLRKSGRSRAVALWSFERSRIRIRATRTHAAETATRWKSFWSVANRSASNSSVSGSRSGTCGFGSAINDASATRAIPSGVHAFVGAHAWAKTAASTFSFNAIRSPSDGPLELFGVAP
mmetsp:Transcript_3420/g.9142  ORF Transcript_3420/g.9142 Transcript_3420/m.9142 type:complete len:201 (+) Transcript_3420:331-933(+)